MADLTVDEIRNSLNFKYYKVPGGKSWLHAIYNNHSVVVILPDDTVKNIDDRIYESLLAMQSYAHEQPDVPAEIVTPNPRKVSKQPDEGAMIVSTKTPQQIEKEAKEEVDRIGGLDGG